MTLVYVLLTIIAVGVLLLSNEGKAFLKSAWVLLLIAGGGVVAFYLAIGGFAFVQSDSFKWFSEKILPWIILPPLALSILYMFLKNIEGDIISKDTWTKKRNYVIWLSILLLIIFCSWVIVPLWLSQ